MSQESATKFPQISDAPRTTKVAAQRISHAPPKLSCQPLQNVRRKKPVPKKNPGKHKSTAEEDDDQARGLWVNTEFFRNLTRRAPQTVGHPTTTEEQNYYLKLAEIILGPTEKRKIDRIETAFQKSPAQSKKRKVP